MSNTWITFSIVFYLIVFSFGNEKSGRRIPDDDDVIVSTETTLPAVTSVPQALECPSDSVFRVKYKCSNAEGKWTDCTRSHCCPGFNLIRNNCVAKDVDPCSLNLCEQRCDVILRRVMCTCWNGYRFSSERQRKGETPTCIDVDECAENTHDCEQICVNTPGEFTCQCQEGFSLRGDNRTCRKLEKNDKGADAKENCSPSCETVLMLERKMNTLQEKMSALETAVKVSIYAPPAKENLQSTDESRRNEKPHIGNAASAAFSGSLGDKTYSVLDSFVQSGGAFCKCQRGPIGPPGPPGVSGLKGDTGDKGQRGAKGTAGNFDFFLLLLADVRHDIVLLQERVFPGETLPKFDIETILKKQRSVDDRTTEADRIPHLGGTRSVQFSDYATGDVPEASGDEWDKS